MMWVSFLDTKLLLCLNLFPIQKANIDHLQCPIYKVIYHTTSTCNKVKFIIGVHVEWVLRIHGAMESVISMLLDVDLSVLILILVDITNCAIVSRVLMLHSVMALIPKSWSIIIVLIEGSMKYGGWLHSMVDLDSWFGIIIHDHLIIYKSY